MMINVMISSTETEAVSVDVHGAEPKPPADARWMRTPNSKGRMILDHAEQDLVDILEETT